MMEREEWVDGAIITRPHPLIQKPCVFCGQDGIYTIFAGRAMIDACEKHKAKGIALARGDDD